MAVTARICLHWASGPFLFHFLVNLRSIKFMSIFQPQKIKIHPVFSVLFILIYVFIHPATHFVYSFSHSPINTFRNSSRIIHPVQNPLTMSFTRVDLLSAVKAKGTTPLSDNFRQHCHDWLFEKFPGVDVLLLAALNLPVPRAAQHLGARDQGGGGSMVMLHQVMCCAQLLYWSL